MKKCYLLILILFISSSIFAQIPGCLEQPSLNDQIKAMLKNLDKRQVPTGILYDSVYPWAEIEAYDGLVDTDTSSYSHFIQAYSEIYNSFFDNTGRLHPTELEKAIDNFHPDKEYHHALGIIDFQYNTIDSNAVINNLLTVSNGQLFDVPNRTSSPYNTQHVRMASLLLANNDKQLFPGTHYLHFTPDFVFTNNNYSLGDAQNLKIYIGNILVLDTTVAGLLNAVVPVVIDAALLSGLTTAVISIVIAHSFIINPIILYKALVGKKDEYPLTECGGQDELVVSGLAFDGGYGSGAYSAGARANIFYADGNCATKKLTKPILFVDGFDPTNAQHGGKLWKNILMFELILGRVLRIWETV